MGWSTGKRKKACFQGSGIPLKNSEEKPAFLPSQRLTSEILLPRRVVNRKTAQIREKTSTNVLDIPDLPEIENPNLLHKMLMVKSPDTGL